MQTRKFCSGCNDYKVKVLGKRNGKGRKMYVDCMNRTWSGNFCPECKMEKQNERLRNSYGEKKEKETVYYAVPKVKRNCRRCDEVLPQTRYFYHELCAPEAYCHTMDTAIF